MKLFIASDIHNDLKRSEKLIEYINREKSSSLILLGDIGRESISLFNQIKEKVVACKGNCDTLDDILSMKFPCHKINYFSFNKKLFVFTHGDEYSFSDYCQSFGDDFDFFLSGHTHRSSYKSYMNKMILNPGSLSSARDGNNSYIVMDEKEIDFICIDDDIVFNKVSYF